ncbi:MerR family transcriptional regulator [Clostridium sp. 'deep sea']|uniref:MerR family transcriptional regulator n=1 Tax=Clostridium sp. 'deep sea' TaxID=2779445 RepID=UPI0018969DD4|nr:MerR family transcriptional regulator [Clostridium sp. 'deep sea']QOR36803.1 MerR family transcriptional regulator [Clostridium sp. 'deep sea']
MVRIGDVSKAYGVSNRTLRYWESAGLIKSTRLTNGYRYFNNDNIVKVKQIVLLRKLNLPLQDISQIFNSTELATIVKVLENHLYKTEQHIDYLKSIKLLLKKLIVIVDSKQSLSSAFNAIDTPNNVAFNELKNALQIALSERKLNLSNVYSSNDVRIVSISKMMVASYRVISKTPEQDCHQQLNKLIVKNNLHQQLGFRIYGYGFNNSEGKYGYEMWVTIAQDFEVKDPYIKKEVATGLYAAIPAYLPIVGERWDQLNSWVEESDIYKLDWRPKDNRHYLEQCIDCFSFNAEKNDANRQLDLLLPIVKINNQEQLSPQIHMQLEPQIVTLPTIILAGCLFEQKENTKLWSKKIPWYKLANSIYKAGDNCSAKIIAGNNTFSLVYGDSTTKAFYLNKNKAIVNSVFAAVQIKQSFKTYPNKLHEKELKGKSYLVFSTWIDPEKVGLKKLKSKQLYLAASEYCEANDCKVDFSYYLEREYRKDGKYVDKIEICIPLK